MTLGIRIEVNTGTDPQHCCQVFSVYCDGLSLVFHTKSKINNGVHKWSVKRAVFRIWHKKC
jgi:hypothetical protein